MEDRAEYDTGGKDEHAPRGGKLLFDTNPLVVIPELAVIIGLNEAIILQQIHYWISHNHKAKSERHHKKGRWWCYNSVREWKEQFPFWSEATIKRALKSLEDKGLVISAQLSDKSTDRRKWYTIDYDTYDNAVGGCANALGQSDQMDEGKMTQSSYTETPPKTSSGEESGASATPPPASGQGVQPDQQGQQASAPAPTLTPSESSGRTPPVPSPPPTRKRTPAQQARDDMSNALLALVLDRTPDQWGTLDSISQTNLRKATTKWLKASVTAEQITNFSRWWYSKDWRGKQGSAPTFRQIGEEWGAYLKSLNGNRGIETYAYSHGEVIG